MKEISIMDAVNIINLNVDDLRSDRDECFALRGDDYIPKEKFITI